MDILPILEIYIFFLLCSQELTKEFPNVVFLKVDVDECEEIAAQYEITSMPTFVFLKNKNKVCN